MTRLLKDFVEKYREMLDRYAPEKAIELLDTVPLEKSYHDLPQELSRLWSAVSRDFGEAGFDAFQRVTMLRLIERFEPRAVGKRYSDSIRERFAISFKRITKSIEDPTFDQYRCENDILFKDLGICSQKLLPAGAQVVEQESGFHRAIVFRGGLYQSLRAIGLLLKTGGNKPFYQIHTHLSELEEFTPEGWDRCYQRIAEMLELNPRIRGVWGGSWFYDPALESISPRLVYLRERPLQHGAALFYSGVDIHGGALSKSKTRQELYDQGKYLPVAYVLIWPRRALLAWAHRFAQGAK